MNNIKLFKGLSNIELDYLLRSNFSFRKKYTKGDIILREGDIIKHIAIVLTGEVIVYKITSDNNRHLITNISANGMFAETFVCAGIHNFPLNVEAKTDTEILFINYNKIISQSSIQSDIGSKLVFNMMKILAEKNMILNNKINILTRKHTRYRILTYLESKAEKGTCIKLKYNKNELADFLGVDRSVLSRELSKMKSEGILTYDKNIYKLL